MAVLPAYTVVLVLYSNSYYTVWESNSITIIQLWEWGIILHIHFRFMSTVYFLI